MGLFGRASPRLRLWLLRRSCAKQFRWRSRFEHFFSRKKKCGSSKTALASPKKLTERNPPKHTLNLGKHTNPKKMNMMNFNASSKNILKTVSHVNKKIFF